MSRRVKAVYLMFALSWLNSDWWTWSKAEKWCWSPWLLMGLFTDTEIIEQHPDVAFHVVLVVTLRLCLSLDGVVHPRAQPGFDPPSVRNVDNAPSNGWNCTNMYLIIQSSWMWNDLGWNNQVCRGSASSQIYQDLPRFAVSCCRDLGFFRMSWRLRRVPLEFLPSWHPEGSDQTVHISHHWCTWCNSIFCSQSCEILLMTIPTKSLGNSSAFMVFPFRNE